MTLVTSQQKQAGERLLLMGHQSTFLTTMNRLIEKDHASAQQAINWVQSLQQHKNTILAYFNQTPLTLDEDGWLELEWKKGKKDLMICFEPTQNYYLKSWGSNMITEMEQGTFNDENDFLRLWNWLME